MKLFNTPTELRAIATICSGNLDAIATFLPHLSVEHFHSAPARTAFERISSLAKTKGEIPSYEDLLVDPVIDEEFRGILASSEYRKPVKDKDKRSRMVDSLDRYRKLRVAFHMAKDTLEELKKSKVDVDELYNSIGDSMAVGRSMISGSDDVLHIGKGNNSSKLIQKVIYDKTTLPIIPTGFKTYDKRNGGFPKSGVVTLAASSGGGKSVAALQLALNCYYSGFSTRVVSLEMAHEQYLARFLSNISGVYFSKIFQKKTTKEEREIIKNAYKKFVRLGKETNTAFSIVAPQSDLTLEQILWAAKPYDDDVLTIDYISLLKGAGGDDQAKALGEISRQAKIWATNTNKLVILLAQLNDEDKVKYSRAIVENSDVVWLWRYGEAEKETEIIDINNYKGRNQETFHFPAKEQFNMMRMTDDGSGGSFDAEDEEEGDSIVEDEQDEL